MKRYFNHIVRSWQSHTVVQLATCVVLSGVFSIISLSLLIHHNLENLFHQWGDSVQVSLYLKDHLEGEPLEEIKELITHSPYFKDIQYISKAAAFKNFKDQTFDYVPDVIFNKDFDNPLPASFEMKVRGDLSSVTYLGGIRNFIERLKSLNGVESVTYGQGWVDNYASFLQIFSYVSGSLIVILLMGSLFVVGNSIRSSLSQRKEEIEILELVGATPTAIRGPYVLDGVLTSLLAASTSLVMCYLLFLWQSQVLETHLSFWRVHLSFLSYPKILIILAMGVSFGALGSWLCISQINSGWAAIRGVNQSF